MARGQNQVIYVSKTDKNRFNFIRPIHWYPYGTITQTVMQKCWRCKKTQQEYGTKWYKPKMTVTINWTFMMD